MAELFTLLRPMRYSRLPAFLLHVAVVHDTDVAGAISAPAQHRRVTVSSALQDLVGPAANSASRAALLPRASQPARQEKVPWRHRRRCRHDTDGA